MLALQLAMDFLLGVGSFQRDDQRLGQNQTLLGTLGFQCLAASHGLTVVAQPYEADAGGRHH